LYASQNRLSRYNLATIMTKDATRLVLVVEDDVSVRRPLVKFLEMHGFSVVTAETSDDRARCRRGDARRRAGDYFLGRAFGIRRA
jgi:hypothetical protein